MLVRAKCAPPPLLPGMERLPADLTFSETAAYAPVAWFQMER